MLKLKRYQSLLLNGPKVIKFAQQPIIEEVLGEAYVRPVIIFYDG